MTSDRLLGILKKFENLKLAVVGDFILDRYMIGDTERISREAPVIVVNYKETRHHPGGAANAAQNITSFKASAEAVGIAGEDAEGEILAGLLTERGVGTSALIRTNQVETAVKIRVTAGELHAQRQQLVRIDRSYQIKDIPSLLAELEKRVHEIVPRSDAVLISDYGMGVVPGPVGRAAIATGRSAGVPVVADSRYHLLGYEGASAATPNETEVREALGYKSWQDVPPERMAEEFLQRTGLAGVIITRGSVGMYAADASGIGRSIGVVGSNEATDVTGAGDTVSAVTALSLAAGATIFEAAEMATYAASVVVMKRGTASVSPQELLDRFNLYSPGAAGE
jgi:rfaE bifunctional protein kinase chain/domain